MLDGNKLVYNPLAEAHYDHGLKEGRKRGWKQGWEEGRREGQAQAILLILEARVLDLREAERDRIASCTDLRRLNKWVRRAVTADKVDDLFA